MNLFKFCASDNDLLAPWTRYIFSMSWIKSSVIRRFNLSLVSLISGSICIGLTIGWQENFLIYNVIASCSNGMCFNVEKFRSTIRLVINLGACLGALIPLCFVDIFGRRNNFAIGAILNTISWLTMIVVITTPALLIGTAICGLATGSFVVTATMYIGEVLPRKSRGTTTALVAFFVYIGVLFSRILSMFVHSRIVPCTMIVMTLGFLVSIYYWMTESPYYLYENGETLKCKLALQHLRGVENYLDVDIEYKSIEIFYTSKREIMNTYNKKFFSVFMIESKKLWRLLIILILIMSQTIGNCALNNYTEGILHKFILGYEKCILSFLDVISIGLYIYFIHKIGSKILIIISISGSSVSYLILAIYSVIQETQCFELNNYFENIMIYLSVIFYCIAYSLGWTPVLPLLTGEVFPNRIKTIAIGLCTSVIYLFAMINQSVFELLDAHKGTYIASIAFTVIGSFGLFSLFIFLPGTSTTVHEIQNEMNDLNVFTP